MVSFMCNNHLANVFVDFMFSIVVSKSVCNLCNSDRQR